ncbi:NAD(P)/FAD-dependent oxidoreductase [Gilliamella sp. B2840]|uniref:NAD(P)/FAD-dependent oxidoreductase n=1 Tax=unclassified Gilliamella TaxID=2685620 RepID=UPI002269A0E0|nr:MULTISPECIES: NAD(P)/FAD-dependent oxidoreductase [unclassified Gilliamella]MCX8656023.1 NAD(P)/FAD-dependent oxidoreductase [Gilliamella sp. B2894]MCX8664126.1 NAD(P)/FAD-dependent oxidoreductase [Gilliamella sp. B2887]MCX8693861.1 NAD(P)/FAD-dependent oxidoreductase [Gilliamella sp. B2881]MCX8695031.1 NAD(P)/FAD-dependent oxidoreductase [Gilliamella sp. B2828]MCX8699007.1 NAD(P)/FAD-dependent oxidoreductase [Gilliamella sp. B3000]
MQTKITIVGAGAAGLFCAGLLGQRGYDVTIIDNGKKIGRKILMSGGGKCNFTNLTVEASNYLSQNPHFCKSALKRFSQWDFIQLVNHYNIAYHEKEHGQLFCDNSAQDIVDMLAQECQKGQVKFMLQTQLEEVESVDKGFKLYTSQGCIETEKLIVATGGQSMPALGMTSIGYKIAEKFSIPVVPVKAGLVPFTLHRPLLEVLSTLSGMAVPVEVSNERICFKENLLFTHRGLSGPAILQISSYWQAGESIMINLLPDRLFESTFKPLLEQNRNQTIKNCLAQILPKRLIEVLIQLNLIIDTTVKQLNPKQQQDLYNTLTHWHITPNGTEGYRTAEVTLGGVSTDALSSKTMAVKSHPNLYFIGEVVDVAGWLGGYNFQWAWSSAFACAQAFC